MLRFREPREQQSTPERLRNPERLRDRLRTAGLFRPADISQADRNRLQDSSDPRVDREGELQVQQRRHHRVRKDDSEESGLGGAAEGEPVQLLLFLGEPGDLVLLRHGALPEYPGGSDTGQLQHIDQSEGLHLLHPQEEARPAPWLQSQRHHHHPGRVADSDRQDQESGLQDPPGGDQGPHLLPHCPVEDSLFCGLRGQEVLRHRTDMVPPHSLSLSLSISLIPLTRNQRQVDFSRLTVPEMQPVIQMIECKFGRNIEQYFGNFTQLMKDMKFSSLYQSQNRAEQVSKQDLNQFKYHVPPHLLLLEQVPVQPETETVQHHPTPGRPPSRRHP